MVISTSYTTCNTYSSFILDCGMCCGYTTNYWSVIDMKTLTYEMLYDNGRTLLTAGETEVPIHRVRVTPYGFLIKILNKDLDIAYNSLTPLVPSNAERILFGVQGKFETKSHFYHLYFSIGYGKEAIANGYQDREYSEYPFYRAAEYTKQINIDFPAMVPRVLKLRS